ncbi:MAG TPA: hypothetical protein VHO47_05670 [Candidatus Babeliales bacterium]|nr:hypothetical protein [Candidatus Babeliales bacterium]
MEFSPGRYEVLKYLLAGLKKTGNSLIEYDGTTLTPIFTRANSVDDIGLFIIVPHIAHFFNIALDQAIDIFFYGLWGLSTFLGMIGIFLIYRKFPIYCGAALVSLISCSIFSLFYVREVYFLYSFTVIACVPIAVYFFKEHMASPWFFPVAFIGGSLCGFAHIIRSYSGLGVALWFLISLWLTKSLKLPLYKKLLLSVLFIAGISFFPLYTKKIEKESTQYLTTHIPSFLPTAHVHPHWHNFYLGFGFLGFLSPNAIEYADGWALDEARQIIPGIDFGDERYDPIVKKLALNFMLRNPLFIILNLWSKIGVLFYYLLRYLHVSIFFIFRKITREKLIPFLSGLAAYSIFPLLTVPANAYTLGLVVFAYINALIYFTDRFIEDPFSKRKKVVVFSIFILFSLINSGIKFLFLHYR